MNSTLLAMLVMSSLLVCTCALADDSTPAPLLVPQSVPRSSEGVQTPQATEAVQEYNVPSGTVYVPHDGKWNRGMISNDGAHLSGAAPYNGPYLGGAWEGGRMGDSLLQLSSQLGLRRPIECQRHDRLVTIAC